MRAKGADSKEVAAVIGFHAAYITQLAAKYRAQGLEAISGNHYGGNHRDLRVEEEAAILEPLDLRNEIQLEYLREYRTYAHIVASYGIAESNIYRGIKWVENTLIQDGTFSLPKRKAPLKSDMEYEVILVNATESPTEHPPKSKDGTIPGRKKSHTLKTKMLVTLKDGQIICLAFANGKKHDFRLFQGIPCSCFARYSVGSGHWISGAYHPAYQFQPAK